MNLAKIKGKIYLFIKKKKGFALEKLENSYQSMSNLPGKQT